MIHRPQLEKMIYGVPQGLIFGSKLHIDSSRHSLRIPVLQIFMWGTFLQHSVYDLFMKLTIMHYIPFNCN